MPELGRAALVVCFGLALYAVVAGFWGAHDGDGDSMQGARFRIKLDRPRAPVGVVVGR